MTWFCAARLLTRSSFDFEKAVTGNTEYCLFIESFGSWSLVSDVLSWRLVVPVVVPLDLVTLPVVAAFTSAWKEGFIASITYKKDSATILSLVISPPAGIRPVCKIMSPQFDSILYYFDIYRWKKLGYEDLSWWSHRTQFFFHPWASPKKIMMRDGGDISLHTGAIPAGRLNTSRIKYFLSSNNSVCRYGQMPNWCHTCSVCQYIKSYVKSKTLYIKY